MNCSYLEGVVVHVKPFCPFKNFGKTSMIVRQLDHFLPVIPDEALSVRRTFQNNGV